MSLPRHPVDESVVDRALGLGADAPLFTRESNPALWRAWALSAKLMIALADAGLDFSLALATCNRVAAGDVVARPRMARTVCDPSVPAAVFGAGWAVPVVAP